MATQSAQFDLATAFLDQPKVLAYGLVRGAGNLVFQQELANKNRIAFYLLGEGPWDSLLRLWLNRKQIALPNTAIAHFHQGLDGEIGFGMGASSTGPDQHVDSFWASVTGTFSLVTWSRYAYLALNVPPDPGAPTADLEVLADYQAMKCRIFDAGGVQTSFAWTQNPAWWICDFLIRKFVLREAKVNQPLVAAELARFDWQSFSDAATYYDADIGAGIKRFSDGGLVFLDSSATADSVLEQMLLLSRSYLLERNGKLSLYADKARASDFTFRTDNIEALSFKAKKSNLRNGKNRINAAYREIGLASGSTDDATRFAIATQTLSHEAHQKAIGARGPGLSVIPKIQELKLDYGNNTAERVARLVQFQLTRQLADDTDPNLAYNAPFDAEWIGFEDSIAVEPADLATIDSSISEEFGGKLFEVLETEGRPDGTILYLGKEYQPNAFTDVAPTQQPIEAPNPGTGLAPVTQLDGSGSQIVSLAKTIDDATSDRRAATANQKTGGDRAAAAIDAGNVVVAAGLDFARAYTGKNLSNVPDDAVSDRRAATASQKTGGDRGFDNIFTDGSYKTTAYHLSAGRRIVDTDRTGSTSATIWVTVASFGITLPPQVTIFQGFLTSLLGTAPAADREARIKIGALSSGIVLGTDTFPKLVSRSGLTAGSVITVEVQAQVPLGTGSSIPHFRQREYNDQDQEHWA